MSTENNLQKLVVYCNRAKEFVSAALDLDEQSKHEEALSNYLQGQEIYLAASRLNFKPQEVYILHFKLGSFLKY